MAKRPAVEPGRWSGLTQLVGDPVRLRVVRLLEREELGVGELARILQLPQSTVSRHLKVLLDAGWVHRRHQGTAGLHRVDIASIDETAKALWSIAKRQVDAAHAASDDARLAGALADRRTDSRTFFGRVGGEWNALRRELFGNSFAHEAMLSLLDPTWTVADLGCGTGDVAELLAPFVKRVIAVDREPLMLEAGRKRLEAHRNVIFRQGELLELPIRSAEIDAAVIMLVLHHLPNPEDALREAARVVVPGGRVLVVDMQKHDRELYARTMGHQHLGFQESEGRAWARRADLSMERWHPMRPLPEAKGPGLFAALFVRSNAVSSSRHSGSSTDR